MIGTLTFDCYDTLVAYSAGKADCLTAMARAQGRPEVAEALVSAQAEGERALHRGPFLPLKEVLRRSLRTAMIENGLDYDEAAGQALENAVRQARPFDDVCPALEALAGRYRLAIISNSEPDIIAQNIAAIGVPFDAAITALESRAYKPDPAMFRFAFERLAVTPADLIHIAQGFYHDIEPGHALGLKRIWINRRGRPGDDAFQPYEELPDMTDLAETVARLSADG